MESFLGTVMVPSSADSSPAIIRKSVVLPAPFGPTSPARSPGLSWKEASTKTTCRPYCLLTEEKEIMEEGGTGGGVGIFVGFFSWEVRMLGGWDVPPTRPTSQHPNRAALVAPQPLDLPSLLLLP